MAFQSDALFLVSPGSVKSYSYDGATHAECQINKGATIFSCVNIDDVYYAGSLMPPLFFTRHVGCTES